jgi:hypothetical protein
VNKRRGHRALADGRGHSLARAAADVACHEKAGLTRLEKERVALDVVAAAAVRCFYSTLLDALGVRPDARFADLDPPMRGALTVGRPIED